MAVEFFLELCLFGCVFIKTLINILVLLYTMHMKNQGYHALAL